MGSVNETKKLVKLLGMLIALPSGIKLGINADIIFNKMLGDAHGQSLFPFPILLFPVTIFACIIIYKVFASLSEKYISSENYKVIGASLIVVNTILIGGIIVWKFMHPW